MRESGVGSKQSFFLLLLFSNKASDMYANTVLFVTANHLAEVIIIRIMALINMTLYEAR